MLFEMIYTSVASENIDDDDIIDILQSSRTNNKINGITGLLIYHKGKFMQILEGKEKNVTTLYHDFILYDYRHHSLEIIWEYNKLKQRNFDTWNMAYINTEEITPKLHDKIKSFIDIDFKSKKFTKDKSLGKKMIMDFKDLLSHKM